MKSKILSLGECEKFCKEYDSNVNYTQVFVSIAFWDKKRKGGKE